MPGGWDDLITAESYAQHTDEQVVYRPLNRCLAQHAVDGWQVPSRPRILDLACGSGATAEALLRVLPFDCELTAVDGAAAMIEQARLRLPDPRIEFLVCRAELLVRRRRRYDLIICGAAFWHFDGAVHTEILELVHDRGRLVFNLPVAQCAGEKAPHHPLQAALAGLLAEVDLLPALHPSIDRAALDDGFAAAGFSAVWHPYRWRGPQAALTALLRIPAMAELVAPDLNAAEFDRLLGRAEARIDLAQTVEVPWWVAVVERPG